MGQNAKNSERADNFRFAPMNGHHQARTHVGKVPCVDLPDRTSRKSIELGQTIAYINTDRLQRPAARIQTRLLADRLPKHKYCAGARRSEMMAATSCCFCGRTVDQVTHLVQGPDLFICDICVDACVDTLATKDHGWRERQIDYLLRLRNRRTLASGN
jgi:hypothetical protein